MSRTVFIWIWMVLPAVVVLGVSERLEIYLPRTVQIEGDVIELGQIGIFHGGGREALRIKTVPLGRFSAPGQKITLDRATIESCLAGAGFEPKKIRFSGAEQVVVSRDESKVSGDQLVAAARAFLETQLAGQDAVLLKPLQIPKAWVASESKPVEITALPGQDRIAGRRTVVLSLRQEGREVDRISVDFEVRYRTRQVVAVKDIAAGEVIDQEQIRLETRETKEPQSAVLETFAGATAKRAIAAGSVLQEQWVQPPVAPVLVQRRQRVILKLETTLMTITAFGEAMDEGSVGQVIRVKRGRRPEERIVLGTVMPDGTVEPLLGKEL